jgi:hypothetical protein
MRFHQFISEGARLPVDMKDLFLRVYAKSYQQFDMDPETVWHLFDKKFPYNKQMLNFFYSCDGVLERAVGPKNKKRYAAHRCYYNSVAYMHEASALHKDLKLAYGFVVEKIQVKRMEEYVKSDQKLNWTGSMLFFATEHAFNVDGNIAVDPTMRGGSDCLYFYKVVPESMWRKFRYIPDDPRVDGRQFSGYIKKQLAGLKDVVKKDEFLRALSTHHWSGVKESNHQLQPPTFC